VDADRQPTAPVATETDPTADVVWSREWEWPAWLRVPRVELRGWRPGRRTLGVTLFVFFAPGAVAGILRLSSDLSLARGVAPGEFSGGYSPAVPDWVRAYYTAQVVLTFTVLAILLGAALLLPWRLVGAAVLGVGLVGEVVGHSMGLAAYLRSGEAPAYVIGQSIAGIASRLVLLGLLVLLLVPRPRGAP
jgi:hypothetical protein